MVGLLSCGDFAALSPAQASGGGAKPVSGSRTVTASSATMHVGRGGAIRTTPAKKASRRYSVSRRTRRVRTNRVATVRWKRSTPTVAAYGTQSIVTGIAVVPEASTVRLVIEATEAFTPEIVPMKSGASPVTIVRVPGTLSDERGVGSVAVHKNGVYSVRYANQNTGMVQFVATTQVEMDAELTPSADKKHWEIVLRRPQTGITQVAINTTGGKGVPMVAAKKAAAPVVVFKPATGTTVPVPKAVKDRKSVV